MSPSTLGSLVGSSQAGLEASPSQLPASCGRGGKGGGQACSQGEGCSWVGADCTPHPRGKAHSKRTEKASAPLCCIHYSDLPTAQHLLWGWVRSTSRGQFCLLCLRCGQQTQCIAPKLGRSPLPDPWLSQGPGDVGDLALD